MASSKIAICNQALGWLGGTLITSFSDNSAEAKLCNANYDALRDAVLEEREWTFAVERIEPARLVSVPKYGFTYEFQIPATVIRVLQVSRKGASAGIVGLSADSPSLGLGDYAELPWLREGQTIRCNAEQIYARVIQQITDTTKHSKAFDQALAARIAMDLAIPLTSSRALQQDMAAMYGEKISLAAASDGMQGRSYKTRSNSLTSVR
jgi:hypothetical protein